MDQSPIDPDMPSSTFQADLSEEPDLLSQMTCCIITKEADESLTACSKFAFSPLTKQLIDAARKHLPFYYSTQRTTQLICLSHRKLILSMGKYNSETTKLNLSHYEVGEAKEMQEFVEKFAAYKQETNGLNTNKESSKKPNFTENYHNLWKRYRDFQEEYEASTNSEATTAKKQKYTKQEGCSEPKTNFEGLSALALRRYKKFFKLSHRTGASKCQIGIILGNKNEKGQ